MLYGIPDVGAFAYRSRQVPVDLGNVQCGREVLYGYTLSDVRVCGDVPLVLAVACRFTVRSVPDKRHTNLLHLPRVTTWESLADWAEERKTSTDR